MFKNSIQSEYAPIPIIEYIKYFSPNILNAKRIKNIFKIKYKIAIELYIWL